MVFRNIVVFVLCAAMSLDGSCAGQDKARSAVRTTEKKDLC